MFADIAVMLGAVVGLSQNYIFYEKINLATMITGAISNYSQKHGMEVDLQITIMLGLHPERFGAVFEGDPDCLRVD